jgi:hypothetical protein
MRCYQRLEYAVVNKLPLREEKRYHNYSHTQKIQVRTNTRKNPHKIPPLHHHAPPHSLLEFSTTAGVFFGRVARRFLLTPARGATRAGGGATGAAGTTGAGNAAAAATAATAALVLPFLGAGAAATGAEAGTAGSGAAEISSALRFLGALVVLVVLAFLGAAVVVVTAAAFLGRPGLRFSAVGAGGGSSAFTGAEGGAGCSGAELSAVLRFFEAGGGGGASALTGAVGGSVAEISAALRFGAGFLTAGALGADGGASEAAASRLSAAALGFLTAGAVGAGGGAATRVALRLAPRPRRGGVEGAGWSGATTLWRFGMGFQPTTLGPDVV